MKSFQAMDAGTDREWLVVDAANKPLGRLAVQLANMLRGKTKPTYTPHVDTGDFVIVLNAARVKLTGRKETMKQYLRFTGYRAGLKRQTAATLRATYPDRMIKQAVKGMLAKNALSRKYMSRLKVYKDEQHPHAAQKPRQVA